jgi:rhodanese-related sulfurtransferase
MRRLLDTPRVAPCVIPAQAGIQRAIQSADSVAKVPGSRNRAGAPVFIAVFFTRESSPFTAASPCVYSASLGIFTSAELQGVRMITARRAADLASRGAQLVDVRTEREFAARHPRGAVNVPHGEKSLKEPQFNEKADNLAGLAKLKKDQPVVFLCSGAECWKSLKDSKVARDAGFATEYWLRGGMPEWTKQGRRPCLERSA